MRRSIHLAVIFALACGNAFGQGVIEPPKSETEVIVRLRAAGQAAIISLNDDGNLQSVRIQRIYGPPPMLPGDLAWLSLCGELEELSMASSIGSAISDDHSKRLDDRLQRLSELPKLRVVSLDRFGVSDDGLRHLGAIGKLETLSVRSDSLTGSGLRQLAMSHSLRTLYIGGNALTDEGTASLAELSGIEVLTLRGENLTDESLAVISKLPNLERLTLGASGKSTKYTPDGLARLAAATNLRMLHLWDAPFDDGFVPALSRMARLESLNLGGSRISESGTRTLAAALPRTRITLVHGEFGPPREE